MLVKTIESEIFLELSTEQQKLLSGGFYGGKRQDYSAMRPDITVKGTLTDSSGQSFPIKILGFKQDSCS